MDLIGLAGRAILAADERDLIDRLVADSAEPMRSYYRSYFARNAFALKLSHGLRPARGPTPPLAKPGDGFLPVCGLVCEGKSELYLLELMATGGTPVSFERVRRSSFDPPGTFRLYADIPICDQVLAPDLLSALLGRTGTSFGSIRASGPASSFNFDDFEWRTGIKMDPALRNLASLHARVMDFDGDDYVWTVSPCPTSNSERSFFIISSARHWLDLLTIDRNYPERGFCYDHLGETVHIPGDFLEAYDMLLRKAEQHSAEES